MSRTQRSLIPRTTVILCDTLTFSKCKEEIERWCSSAHYPPYASAYLIDIVQGTLVFFNKHGNHEQPEKVAGILSTILFVNRLKPSILINVSTKLSAALISAFTKAGVTFGHNLIPFLFHDISLTYKNHGSLLESLPNLFLPELPKKPAHTAHSKADELEVTELGKVPVDAKEYLVWFPNPKTRRDVFTHFRTITYYAESKKLAIVAHLDTEKEQSMFASVFFSLGRKSELDALLTVTVGNAKLEKHKKHAERAVFSVKRSTHFKAFQEKGIAATIDMLKTELAETK